MDDAASVLRLAVPFSGLEPARWRSGGPGELGPRPVAAGAPCQRASADQNPRPHGPLPRRTNRRRRCHRGAGHRIRRVHSRGCGGSTVRHSPFRPAALGLVAPLVAVRRRRAERRGRGTRGGVLSPRPVALGVGSDPGFGPRGHGCGLAAGPAVPDRLRVAGRADSAMAGVPGGHLHRGSRVAHRPGSRRPAQGISSRTAAGPDAGSRAALSRLLPHVGRRRHPGAADAARDRVRARSAGSAAHAAGAPGGRAGGHRPPHWTRRSGAGRRSRTRGRPVGRRGIPDLVANRTVAAAHHFEHRAVQRRRHPREPLLAEAARRRRRAVCRRRWV